MAGASLVLNSDGGGQRKLPTVLALAVGTVVLVYLMARILGFDQQVTLHLSDAARLSISTAVLGGVAFTIRNLLHRGSSSAARERLKSRFPSAWPLVGIAFACGAGTGAFLLTAEIAKIFVPYVSGSATQLRATVARSGTAQELYGRQQLFDRCEVYVDFLTDEYPTYRLCARGSGGRQLLSIGEVPAVGSVVRISVYTNFLGTYATRIVDEPSR